MNPRATSTYKPVGLITDAEKKYFMDIFNLNARSTTEGGVRRLDFDGLAKVFDMVGFEPDEKQMKEFGDLFARKKEMTFEEFLQVF